MSKKVVFFSPSFASTEATALLGILAVATPLLRAGFSVRLIDATITRNLRAGADCKWSMEATTNLTARLRLKKSIPSFKPAVDKNRLEPVTGGAAC